MFAVSSIICARWSTSHNILLGVAFVLCRTRESQKDIEMEQTIQVK